MIKELVIKKAEGNEVTLAFHGLLSPFACKLALARTELSGLYDATGCFIQVDITKVNVAKTAKLFYNAYLEASCECKELLALQKDIEGTYKTNKRGRNESD